MELVESSEINIISKALEAAQILSEAFKQLKVFILAYDFKDEEFEPVSQIINGVFYLSKS